MLLLVADGEFALRLLVLLAKVLQFLDRIVLHDRDAELYVLLGVLMAGLQHGGPKSAQKLQITSPVKPPNLCILREKT